MKRTICIFIFLMIFSSNLFCAAQNAGGFLEKGIGARAAALNYSYVALADDSAAIYWNPAGLSQAKCSELSSMFYKAFEADFFSFAFTFPFENLNIGIGYLGAAVNDIKEDVIDPTTGRGIDTGKTFSDVNHAFMLSSAMKISKYLSFGLTGKLISERLYNANTLGGALDCGILFKPNAALTLGLDLHNVVASDLKWSTGAIDRLPTILNAGLAVNLFQDKMLVATDINQKLNRPFSSVEWRVGLEYNINSFLSLRGGFTPTKFNGFNRIIDTMGIGLRLGQLILDLAWINQDEPLDISEIEDIYRLSVTYCFPEEETQSVNNVVKAPSVEVSVEPPVFVAQKDQPSLAIEPVVAEKPMIEKVEEVQAPKEISNLIEPLQSVLTSNTNSDGNNVFTYEIKGGKPGTEYYVDLYVKDAYGKTIKELIKNRKAFAGSYQIEWNNTNDKHFRVNPGDYYLRLYVTSPDEVSSSHAKISI